MKMVKKTLIAIALVAFLASTAPAAIDVYYWGPMDKETGVKSDGRTYVYWPYEYKALDICSMPIKMNVGMYVDVKDCTDRKIILEQVDCSDIGKAGEYPCYYDCETINVRANFEVKLGTRVVRESSALNSGKIEGFYDGDDVIPGDGSYHAAKVCVRAWSVDLWNQPYGHEITVGTLYITAKPNFAPEYTEHQGWPGQE
jgi:hypothetical protein